MKKSKILFLSFLILLFSTIYSTNAWAVTLKSISVSSSKLNLSIGNTEQLKVTAIYSDKSEEDVTSECKYTNSNKKIISIDKSGSIKALKKGNSKITIKYGSKKAIVNVSVVAEQVKISGILTFMCDYKASYLANFDICFYGQCQNPDKPQYITNIYGVPNDKIVIKDKSKKLILEGYSDQDGCFELIVPVADYYYVDYYFGDIKKSCKLYYGDTEDIELSVGRLKSDKVDEILGINNNPVVSGN